MTNVQDAENVAKPYGPLLLLENEVKHLDRAEMVRIMLTAWAGWDPTGLTDWEPVAEAAAKALLAPTRERAAHRDGPVCDTDLPIDKKEQA